MHDSHDHHEWTAQPGWHQLADPLPSDQQAPWTFTPTHADPSPTVEDVARAGLETGGAYFALRKLGALLGRRQRREAGDTEPLPHVAPSTAGADPASEYTQPQAPQAGPDDRSVLVEAMVDVESLLRERALREKLHRALARVGVTAVDPVGELFDPERHRAVGSEPTSDPDLHDRVVFVERLGFVDGGREVRLPDVIVWRYDAAFTPEAPQ